VQNPLLNDVDDDDEEDENEETMNMSPQELQAYYDEKRKKRTEEIEKLLEKGQDDEDALVKEGDYTVQVKLLPRPTHSDAQRLSVCLNELMGGFIVNFNFSHVTGRSIS